MGSAGRISAKELISLPTFVESHEAYPGANAGRPGFPGSAGTSSSSMAIAMYFHGTLAFATSRKSFLSRDGVHSNAGLPTFLAFVWLASMGSLNLQGLCNECGAMMIEGLDKG
jgi:hypothetical protein